VVGKCFLVQQNVYTVFRLRKTCSSCLNSRAQPEESISLTESVDSLPAREEEVFFCLLRFVVGGVESRLFG
jgi:hypothetical protein